MRAPFYNHDNLHGNYRLSAEGDCRMDQSVVVNALYDRYIAPMTQNKERSMGVEIEMPIVNLAKQPVDFDIVHELTASFAERFRMDATGTDEEGHVYSLQQPESGDVLSYDCSYNNLEISLGKGRDLHELNERFLAYYRYITYFLEPAHHTLTGMGVNPHHRINRNIPIHNERYRMLYHYLGLYKRYSHPDFFHPYPHFGMFSSASQVQIDVTASELIETLDVFSRLEPIKALLFANSVMPEEEGRMICVRDMLWENSMHGVNPRNVGFYDEKITSIDDLLTYMAQESMYCTMRGGKYINFHPTPVMDFFNRGAQIGEFWNGTTYERTRVIPEIADLQYLRPFKLEDVTHRGTIEFRSTCCQPIADCMTVAAFHIGLFETKAELKALLNDDHNLYGHGWNAQALRKSFCRGEIPDFIDHNQLWRLISRVLDLARSGLDSRGRKEAVFLAPLYRRAEERTNPAWTYLQALARGTTQDVLIKRYAAVE